MSVAMRSLALLLGFNVACGAQTACRDEKRSDHPNTLWAEPLREPVRFDAASSPLEVHMRAKLSGLPILWQDTSNILGGSVSLSVFVEYESEPKGNDGRTQMPRVSASLGIGESSDDIRLSTTSFPAGSVSDEHRLFDTCAYSEQTCVVPLVLKLRRLDGSPFPPIVATFSVAAGAAVSPCPLEEDVTTKISLKREDP